MLPPGPMVLFGSGETAAAGRRAHDYVFAQLGRPIDVAILGTPAGFEPNAAAVIERIGRFFETSLQQYRPDVSLVEARRNDAPRGTNDSSALAPLLQANYLFFGPGSPSYAVRHLRDSVALGYLRDRWRAGAAVGAASAAAIALGRCALPVYEVFKAGHDPHWLDGLDLLGPLGYRLAVVPHWNNTEGGQELDTGHCFMGAERFQLLSATLPADVIVLGIDEHTACVLDFGDERGRVIGAGGVTIGFPTGQLRCVEGESFDLADLRSGSASSARSSDSSSGL